MAVVRREFFGPWSGYGATHPSVKERVIVDKSGYSTKDVFVQAGCQKGYLHITTALELARNLFEAAEEMLPTLGMQYVVEVTDPRGGKHQYSGVTEITCVHHQWSLFSGEIVLTGPHVACEGWVFTVKPDPLIEGIRRYSNARKEVNTAGPQAGKPEPPA